LVSHIEYVIMEVLSEYAVAGSTHPGAPGVYINGAKIAALGLRIRNGCTYHGISLNVDMDLAPFDFIDPCGYESLPVTQLRDLGVSPGIPDLETALASRFQKTLGYSSLSRIPCEQSSVSQY
ncbi:MAG: lipoyl(octanoyl) transferase LipB, partial [Pseudomonadota bacterium]|nr:lipoyl(octanoyl) transferase LipB [Pseudomonadota bacterium]